MAAIYPAATANNHQKRPLASLKTFIREFLQSSRTSFSTLQLALLYLVRINRRSIKGKSPIFACGRRMFVAALIVASKVNLDNSPKNSAWANLSGLDINQINEAERLCLSALEYRAVVPCHEFQEWNALLHAPSAELLRQCGITSNCISLQ